MQGRAVDFQPVSVPLFSDILKPEVRLSLDELHHEHHATGILQYIHLDSATPQESFFPLERHVLSDDYVRYAV